MCVTALLPQAPLRSVSFTDICPSVRPPATVLVPAVCCRRFQPLRLRCRLMLSCRKLLCLGLCGPLSRGLPPSFAHLAPASLSRFVVPRRCADCHNANKGDGHVPAHQHARSGVPLPAFLLSFCTCADIFIRRCSQVQSRCRERGRSTGHPGVGRCNKLDDYWRRSNVCAEFCRGNNPDRALVGTGSRGFIVLHPPQHRVGYRPAVQETMDPLSSKAEFMLGVGPQWAYIRQSGRSSHTLSGEVAGDFMFWPTGRHHFGWYFEPAYDYSFAGGHPQSIGVSAGLLLGIGRKHP